MTPRPDNRVRPELNPNRCRACAGTGKDPNKPKVDEGYIRCWECNGNGLDPAAYFTWRP